MLINRNQKLALIHLAKKKLGLSDDQYRAVLVAVTGVDSSAQLQSERQFDDLMTRFLSLGFSTRRQNKRPTWSDFWRCTSSQRAQIEVLWKRVARSPTPESLRKFVQRMSGIDAPNWLDKTGATKVILALKKLAIQAGKDPENAT